jgi:three-Cys-motif partner protein
MRHDFQKVINMKPKSIALNEDELIGEHEDGVDLWKKEPHTEAKHKILDGYLKAWLPILGSSTTRLIYLDGFAGPGEYEGGEDGSPIIALKMARDHILLNHKILRGKEIIFYFIDKNCSYCENLKGKITEMELPENFKCHVECAKFDEHLTAVLDQLDGARSMIAPTFAFIDPFGYSNTPMSVISRFMKNPKCEVFINFMVGSINRWSKDSGKAKALNGLFGTNEWGELAEIKETMDRINAYANLYEEQLKNAANIKYVRRFLMINRSNQPLYFLFFGTNGKPGLKAMKRAMWDIDLDEGFLFSDMTDPTQTVLFAPSPDYDRLKKTLLSKFKGKKAHISEIEDFVLTDTPFMPDRHLKKPVLVPLEDEGRIKIYPLSGTRRRHTFRNCNIDFI